jgi:hypothetical protein
MVNFIPLFLLTFTKRLTSSVFTRSTSGRLLPTGRKNVTIGMGDDIHIWNASARLLS